MMDNEDKIHQLSDKLEMLLKRQEVFAREINELVTEINHLKHPKETGSKRITSAEQHVVSGRYKTTQPGKLPGIKSDIEKFIGENLINKIGILIIVFGVAIGAKYSIERDLVSPVMRLVLGYLTGFALLGFGLLLKRKYESYSAVLVSGAMAIMYFITYTACNFYHVMPQTYAFALMVIFTISTTIAAIRYSRQVIAHIGLVGAYAVPFLLSDGSGQVEALFTYMAIINIGILVIAFRKYWKPLYYSSFGLTWLVYFVWYVSGYQVEEHFTLGLAFLTLFFGIFYLTALAYKLRRNEDFKLYDIVLLLSNAFIFYGVGYVILQNHPVGENLLGVFSLVNSIVHFIVSAIINRQKLADKNLFYLVSGLVLIFITIAIPVQLNGNWVTLLWAGEAALLFWIGRTRHVSFYERLSVILMILAFFSLLHDWKTGYDVYVLHEPGTRIEPFLNIQFLASLMVVAAFGYINVLNRGRKFPLQGVLQAQLSQVVFITLPTLLLFTFYGAFAMEIATYWDQLEVDLSMPAGAGGQHINEFKSLWMINYTLAFTSVLSFVAFRIKSRPLTLFNLGLSVFAVGIFLIYGLYVLSDLRQSNLAGAVSGYYLNGGIRYISLILVAVTLLAGYKCINQVSISTELRKWYILGLHAAVLWAASSELIHWMDLAASTQSYKLGLSILWGVYALFLIAIGIWKQKKHLRIGAIALFGITLIKLFVFDISHLNTASKTIVFVSLGTVLLIVSFLYNKYKHMIAEELS